MTSHFPHWKRENAIISPFCVKGTAGISFVVLWKITFLSERPCCLCCRCTLSKDTHLLHDANTKFHKYLNHLSLKSPKVAPRKRLEILSRAPLFAREPVRIKNAEKETTNPCFDKCSMWSKVFESCTHGNTDEICREGESSRLSRREKKTESNDIMHVFFLFPKNERWHLLWWVHSSWKGAQCLCSGSAPLLV